MSVHYHVIENTPGYMPDSDEPPFTYTSRRAAEQSAKDRADEYRNDGEGYERQVRDRLNGETYTRQMWRPFYRVVGSMREGYYVTRRDSEHDLGRVIYVGECDEAECLEGEEQ